MAWLALMLRRRRLCLPGDRKAALMNSPEDIAPLEIGSPDPTPEKMALARRLLYLHRRVHVPEPACNWCLKPWPCADGRWATVVLQRAGRVDD